MYCFFVHLFYLNLFFAYIGTQRRNKAYFLCVLFVWICFIILYVCIFFSFLFVSFVQMFLCQGLILYMFQPCPCNFFVAYVLPYELRVFLSQECGKGTWGSGCVSHCDSCINSTCNNTDGTCLTGCRPGYKSSPRCTEGKRVLGRLLLLLDGLCIIVVVASAFIISTLQNYKKLSLHKLSWSTEFISLIKWRSLSFINYIRVYVCH